MDEKDPTFTELKYSYMTSQRDLNDMAKVTPPRRGTERKKTELTTPKTGAKNYRKYQTTNNRAVATNSMNNLFTPKSAFSKYKNKRIDIYKTFDVDSFTYFNTPDGAPQVDSSKMVSYLAKKTPGEDQRDSSNSTPKNIVTNPITLVKSRKELKS